MQWHVPFVAKRPAGEEPWRAFGAARADYERWAGHVCAMACVRSLLLARFHQAPTLWELTQRARDIGVYREHGDGRIDGAFHHPLVALLGSFGLGATVFARLPTKEVVALGERGAILLSIDLAKADRNLSGSHLVLTVGREADGLIVHDNARVLSATGESLAVTAAELDAYSNGRGVFVPWEGLTAPER